MASRGSISMKSAVLKISTGGEKLRFEVQSTPHHRPGAHHAHGPQPLSNSGTQKWYMKANHPAEVARWTQAIKKSIEWYQTHNGDVTLSASQSGSLSDASSFQSRNKSRKSFRRGSVNSSGNHDYLVRNEPAEVGVPDGEHDEPEDTRSVAQSSTSGSVGFPPFSDTIELQGNTTMAQLELTGKLLTTITLPTSGSSHSIHIEEALKESFTQLQGLMSEYIRMAKEREEWYKEKLHKERDRTSMWEESLSVVVREGEALERELRKRGRAKPKRRSTFNASDTASPTIRQRPTRDLPPLPAVYVAGPSVVPSSSLQGFVQPQASTVDRPDTVKPIIVVPSPSLLDSSQQALSDTDGVDTDDEDEFFDAIESNNLPNLIVSDTLKSPISPITSQIPPSESGPYQGYTQLRDRLPIKSDDRPSTSLWQVLKGSIGKDLTRISFPVYFNEPTSMLQRMVSVCFLGEMLILT